MTGRLNRAQRRRDLDELSRGTVDVLVVGGGVVGAGSALDAASRGLTVGLLEQDDWASGTSSRSSRLAHGGLRYLEQLEFGLVHEALTERGLLLDRLAPHLVHPVRFVFPLSTQWERPYVGAGVALYDMLARFGTRAGSLPGHRHLSKRATLRLVPGLDEDAFSGAVTFFDAQIDDARHTLATVRTAAAHGAHVVSRARVESLIRDGDTVTGVTVLDRETGERKTVRARVIVAALGVWSGGVDTWLKRDARRTVTPSKGAHILVDRSAIASHSAVIARTANSVLFLLPWGNHWLIGTTDTPWTKPADTFSSIVADEDEIEYLLQQANRWLSQPLHRSDVVASYAGLRPLVADPDVADESTSKLSREHLVETPAPGLVSVTGGKYTTYRVMAADAVDVAVRQLPSTLEVGPSRTSGVPLVGANDFFAVWEQRAEEAASAGLSVPVMSRLLRRHGDQVDDVLRLIRDDPALAEPLGGSRYLQAEVVVAASSEGAMTVDDVLVRRTRLAQETRDAGAGVASEVADLMTRGDGLP